MQPKTPSSDPSKYISKYKEIQPYTTKDESVIRELMHPTTHSANNASLAEARVPEGTSTLLHKHKTSEELYYVTQGEGLMHLGSEEFEIREGDTVCIKPDTPHKVKNTGEKELVILCVCSPAYQHTDTLLLKD